MKKLGKGPVNWKRERRKRYAAMGPQNIGTTYHTVRVAIYGAEESRQPYGKEQRNISGYLEDVGPK